MVIYYFLDPGIRGAGVPRAAVHLHKALTPRYEKWAHSRMTSGKAKHMSTMDISGTEWPLFGSVMYLWATVSLQEAWEKNHDGIPYEPKVYAKGAIEAATQLVIDPGHAHWVKVHWGDEYLSRENVFYRMLVIAALTSHQELTADDAYLPMLQEQVEGLANEIDRSAYGILDDYPGECYPTDVLTAIACIRRADAVLGTDHSDFADRAVRGFQGALLDERGLPPYAADSREGKAITVSRGCGNSYACLFAPHVWPELAQQWYGLYEKHFWQKRWMAVGFREFPKDLAGYDWYVDVDAGPVLAGHGIAAGAFGAGAARTNGRFDHAYPLTAEILAASWPLPDGTLAGPRLLSNATDAPYLGEAAILYLITRQPAATFPIKKGGTIAAFAYFLLSLYWGLGLLMVLAAARNFKRMRSNPNRIVPFVQVQIVVWLILAIAAALTFVFWNKIFGLILLFMMLILPKDFKCKMRKNPTESQ